MDRYCCGRMMPYYELVEEVPLHHTADVGPSRSEAAGVQPRSRCSLHFLSSWMDVDSSYASNILRFVICRLRYLPHWTNKPKRERMVFTAPETIHARRTYVENTNDFTIFRVENISAASLQEAIFFSSSFSLSISFLVKNGLNPRLFSLRSAPYLVENTGCLILTFPRL